MGVQSGNVPVNIQDRKILPGTSIDQGSTGIPNMTSQVISSAGSPMTNTMHSAPPSMTTVQGDVTGNTQTPYGKKCQNVIKMFEGSQSQMQRKTCFTIDKLSCRWECQYESPGFG